MSSSGDAIIDMPPEPASAPAFEQLDFLDPAVANTPKGIVALTIDTGDSSSHKGVQQRPLPRWKTPEFMLYGVVFLVVIPLMVWTPVQLSQCKFPKSCTPTVDLCTTASHPQYAIYQRRLSQGWILGRKIVCLNLRRNNSRSRTRSGQQRQSIPLLSKQHTGTRSPCRCLLPPEALICIHIPSINRYTTSPHTASNTIPMCLFFLDATCIARRKCCQGSLDSVNQLWHCEALCLFATRPSAQLGIQCGCAVRHREKFRLCVREYLATVAIFGSLFLLGLSLSHQICAGYATRCLSSMVHQFQHYHVKINFVQSGLLLGLSPEWTGRCKCSDFSYLSFSSKCL